MSPDQESAKPTSGPANTDEMNGICKGDRVSPLVKVVHATGAILPVGPWLAAPTGPASCHGAQSGAEQSEDSRWSAAGTGR